VLPPELDLHSENVALVNAALTAGLYPKILSVDLTQGLLQTVTNNRAVAFHPSSVNFKRRLQDFGARYLAFFTIMFAFARDEVAPVLTVLQALEETICLGNRAGGRLRSSPPVRGLQFQGIDHWTPTLCYFVELA